MYFVYGILVGIILGLYLSWVGYPITNYIDARTNRFRAYLLVCGANVILIFVLALVIFCLIRRGFQHQFNSLDLLVQYVLGIPYGMLITCFVRVQKTRR